MSSTQSHRKQLAKYLTDKQKQNTSGTLAPRKKKTVLVHVPPRRGKATIYDLPSEIIMKIFEYLTMGDLLSAAQVCHLWHQLSSDNMLWKPLLEKCLPQQTLTGNQEQHLDFKTINLKSSFMKRCIEIRNKRILRLLKKKNPYTGIINCKDVENSIKFAGISWQIVLTDTSGNGHTLQHQDVSYHLMSVSIRWFSLTMIPFSNVKNISVYSCNPLFFDNSTGKAISNGPYQRSLLYSMDTKLSLILDKLKPVGSDENLKVYALEDGIIIGIWREGGEIAFVTISNGLPGFVKRCVMGSASQMYQATDEQCTDLKTESTYGLYGYSCTVQLRTMKQDIWDQQFTNVECPNSNICNGFAQFCLLKENERQMVQKELVFPWKTDAFKGKVKDLCCMDVVLTNNDGKVIWFCSSAVSVKKDGCRKIAFDNDFEYCRELSRCIEYSDQKGKVFIQIDKNEDTTFITHISLKVSTDVLSGKNTRGTETPMSPLLITPATPL